MKNFSVAVGLVLLCMAVCAGCSRHFEVIRDILEIPQDHRHYITRMDAGRPLLVQGAQVVLQERYLRWFFAPWHQQESPYSPEAVRGFFNRYLRLAGEGEGIRFRRMTRVMVRQADLSSFPSVAQRAITLYPTNMRGLPTGRPLPDVRNGTPLPPLRFDRLQVSSIPAGTPVYVSHRSRDRLWCLAETGFAIGWLPAWDLALVDDAFVAQWETGTYAAVVKDKKNIPLPGGRHMDISVGNLFPVVGERPDGLEILTARSNGRGSAVPVQTTLSRDMAVKTPWPLTPEHLVALANEFVGEPYGWGGQHGRRDCSSMIRDLFAPFGIWLPRHSADQALEGGWFVDLAGKSREEKETAMITRGVPYLTLLWLKGHIMLYVGTLEGRPLVFHNFWSVRTTNLHGIRGKKIVGQTAITTLHPGWEFQPPGSSDGNLLDALQGMTFLVAPNFLVNR